MLLPGPRAKCPHFNPAASQVPRRQVWGLKASGTGKWGLHSTGWEQDGTGRQVLHDCRFHGCHPSFLIRLCPDAAHSLAIEQFTAIAFGIHVRDLG